MALPHARRRDPENGKTVVNKNMVLPGQSLPMFYDKKRVDRINVKKSQ